MTDYLAVFTLTYSKITSHKSKTHDWSGIRTHARRLVPKTSALDHSAIQPFLVVAGENTVIEIAKDKILEVFVYKKNQDHHESKSSRSGMMDWLQKIRALFPFFSFSWTVLVAFRDQMREDRVRHNLSRRLLTNATFFGTFCLSHSIDAFRFHGNFFGQEAGRKKTGCSRLAG